MAPASPKKGQDAYGSTGNELEAVFQAIDKDGSGTISASELALAIKAAMPGTADEEVAEMVALSGVDGAQTEMSLEQFVMFMLFKLPVRAPAPAA